MSQTKGPGHFALCSLLFLYCTICSAQESENDFGNVTNDELKLKECAFDKSADAIVLLDKAVSYFNDQFQLITERRIRLKILKEKGVQRGNIRIVYYSNEDYENINGVEAVVTTPDADNNLSVQNLERKNIFTKQLNRLYSEVTFALPNVKVGSIIDYKYRSNMKNYGGLRNWEFQKELPVVVSAYDLTPIPNSEFAYTVYKKTDLPIIIKPNNEAGKIHFEMHDIPGLRDEVYSPSPKNFLQRVNFQFASYRNYYGTTSYNNTWQELTKELLSNGDFGSQADKNLSNIPFLKSLSPTLTQEQKIKMIYDFVRATIVWDEIYSKYSESGVKTTFEKKKGNSGDINLLLVSLLRSAGLEAYPLLVSDRDQGKIDTTYSYIGQFSKVAAYVMAGSNAYVLDGTDYYTPYFMVPTNLLNTIGFVVDKKKGGFIYFKNLPHRQLESIFIQGQIKEDGEVEAAASVSKMNYSKVFDEERYKSRKPAYLENLVKPHSFVKVDSFELEGLNNDSVALVQRLKFHYELKKAGNYYLLNYNLFTGFDENPFITQHRFTDIDLATKYQASLVGSFKLPPSLVAETVPANKSLVSPDRSLSVSRAIEKAADQINLRITIAINKETFSAYEYDMIKSFYKEMLDFLNEPILLKAK